MKKPNFFIIGAPKCGTTSLANYLRAHPQVFFSHPKEPFFFSPDVGKRFNVIRELSEYEQLFAEAGEEHIAVGEGSTSYLRSHEAAHRIWEYQPGAKIIAVLRDPMTHVPSLHNEALLSRSENVRDFEEAWGLQGLRKQGRRVPRSCFKVEDLFYAEAGRYSQNLEQYFTLFPRERIKIFLFDELAADTARVYRDILEFLGVDPEHEIEFAVHNPRRSYRSTLLKSWMLKTPKALVRPVLRVKEALGVRELGVFKTLEKLNKAPVEKRPLSREVKEEIIEAYRDEVQKLSVLIGRDLSHWLLP